MIDTLILFRIYLIFTVFCLNKTLPQQGAFSIPDFYLNKTGPGAKNLTGSRLVLLTLIKRMFCRKVRQTKDEPYIRIMTLGSAPVMKLLICSKQQVSSSEKVTMTLWNEFALSEHKLSQLAIPCSPYRQF